MDVQFMLNILSYMAIYSFFGWLLESVSKTIAQKQFVNSGFLKGPLCPIYGFGALIMFFCLGTLKEKPLILFMVAFVVLSIWEYIVGVLLEKIFKTKYWDYSECKFNFQGRICLKNSIYWGVLGVIFIKYIHPFIENKVSLIPFNLLLYIVIIIYIAIIVDTIATIITTAKFDFRVQKVNELSEKIKLVVEEIKKYTTNSQTKLKAEKLLHELKVKETKLKLKLYRKARRLKLAFPTMKSESITSFLNEKIDFETLKKLIRNKNKE